MARRMLTPCSTSSAERISRFQETPIPGVWCGHFAFLASITRALAGRDTGSKDPDGSAMVREMRWIQDHSAMEVLEGPVPTEQRRTML